MPDLAQRWRNIRNQQERLQALYPGGCLHVRLKGTEGIQGISLVTTDVGGQLIASGSHIECLPSEVTMFEEHQRREGERIGAVARKLARINHENGGGYGFKL